MKKIIFSLLLFLFTASLPVVAQRKMDNLDRGVVAVRNSSGNFFVSWRYFATDPDAILFNLYAKKIGDAGFTKLNTTPLKYTNYVAVSGSVAGGTQLYVTTVINQMESAPSGIFTVPANGFTTYRSAYLDIPYNPANDGLDLAAYSTKFCWPADLDGDGEYDFVVDRLSTTGGSHKIQAYLRDGTLLWTVDMGPNSRICEGQDDMVISYDLDGDKKAEVVIKSSDGTQFADGKGVFGSTTLDTDNDGIINYFTQNVRNSPQYITVIDGLTGLEKNSIEMKYPSNYTRTNKANFMGDEYNNLNGHMAILYLDGKHPSVGFLYKTRTTDGRHWYYASAYGYDKTGQWVNHYNWERGSVDAAEGHGLRVADVDLDGRDELLNIGFGLKYDGTLAFNAHIGHGDRYRIGDIDPTRPGLETFAIQQSNMLGQLLYDSSTGDPIKKYYLSSVGDVGRGECMDIDSTHLGYEFWSTMPNMYDSKGDIIFEGATPFPREGVWWDGDLAREELSSSDGSGFNADIRKYDPNSRDFGNRLIEFAKMTGWRVKSEYGVRPAFIGDIAGDWREEIVLEKSGVASDGVTKTCEGIVAFSTDYPTSNRIYCLMQNPAYSMQSTIRGYYQSPFPDFYLGYNMPTPPLSPVQKAKLTWTSGTSFDKTSSNFVLEDETTTSTFADGDDVMFDISGANGSIIQLNSDLAPLKIWAMNPKDHDYTVGGTGKFIGNMELVKSMNGTFTLNGNHTFTGKTTVSEGTLFVNGSIESPVLVQAKGTFGGNAIVNGGITMNPGLNIEGGRLSPGNGLAIGKLGKMTVNGDLTLGGNMNVHFDFLPIDSFLNDSLVINGNLNLSGVNNIVVNTQTGVLPAGTYSLIKWTGTLTGSLSNFVIAGISGLPVSLAIEDNTLKLIVNSTRSTGSIVWSGNENESWDFISANFKLAGNATYFVNNDSVLFNDLAVNKIVSLVDNMKTSNVSFENNSTYVLKGTGGVNGTSNFMKSGKGLLDIQTKNNSYTGKTILNNALVQIASLADGGEVSSLGASSVDPANLSLTDSRLIVNSITANTNRGFTMVGMDTITVPKSNGVVSFSGRVTGTGKLVKNGPGQLNLAGGVANTYTGGTVINGSKIALGSTVMNKSGLGTGPITFENGGRFSMFYGTGDYSQTPIWNLIVEDKQTGYLDASGRCIIGGSLTGSGIFNYYVPYVRADWTSNCSNFTGTFNVTTDGDGGSFRIISGAGFPQNTVNLANLVGMGAYSSTGSSSENSSVSVVIGALTGVKGSTLGAGKWQIGNNNKNAVFNGTISSTATITKIGTGNWTLTGANNTTNVVNINGGTLTASNTTGSATGSGSVYVNNGGTLAGSGIISGSVVVNSGGELSPGNNSISTLTVGPNLVLQSNSKLKIEVSSVINDKISVSNTVLLNGTLEMINNYGSFKSGDTYTILNAGTISGTFSAISPEIPGEGLSWNTSRLSEGIISVELANGIEDIYGSSLIVYPSQVKDHCVVSVGGLTGRLKIELVDQVGRVISSEMTDSSVQNFSIPMSNLHSGFYLVKVTTQNQEVYVRKVIKE